MYLNKQKKVSSDFEVKTNFGWTTTGRGHDDVVGNSHRKICVVWFRVSAAVKLVLKTLKLVSRTAAAPIVAPS